jgi:hypothetical protein
VPESYRGDEHIGDCVIALEIANRIGASVLAVMQNLKMIQGKPGWSAQFLISCLNATKRFSPIRYQMTGTRGKDNWGCIAWAIDRTGETLKSPEVTICMAKAEGWYDQEGSKWKTMPELMLCYRSATLFTRLYAPEITIGIQTTEEVADTAFEGKRRLSRPVFAARFRKPKLKTKNRTEPKRKASKTFLTSPSSAQKNGSTTAATSAIAETKAAPLALTVAPVQSDHFSHFKALTALLRLSRHQEADVLRFLSCAGKCRESWASLAEMAQKEPNAIAWAHDNWQSLERELTRIKKGRAL